MNDIFVCYDVIIAVLNNKLHWIFRYVMNISCILDYVIIIHVNDNLQCIYLIIMFIHDDVMIIVC